MAHGAPAAHAQGMPRHWLWSSPALRTTAPADPTPVPTATRLADVVDLAAWRAQRVPERPAPAVRPALRITPELLAALADTSGTRRV